MRRPETSATEYYFTISFVTLRSPSASFTIWNDGMEAVVPLYVPSYTSSGDFEASLLMKNCRLSSPGATPSRRSHPYR